MQTNSFRCNDLMDNGLNIIEFNERVADEWEGLIIVWLMNQTLSGMKLR